MNIPLKDAAILANCPDREVRWNGGNGFSTTTASWQRRRHRAWLRLGEAVALDREQILFEEARRCPVYACRGRLRQFRPPRRWQEAASSSLTELFALQIDESRLDAWPTDYPWIDAAGYLTTSALV